VHAMLRGRVDGPSQGGLVLHHVTLGTIEGAWGCVTGVEVHSRPSSVIDPMTDLCHRVGLGRIESSELTPRRPSGRA
jgi:hypothetical protein